MDYYCINDNNLWINLEIFILKKSENFSPQTMIKIMSHFAHQQEGSSDFYDYFEH